MKTKKKLNCQNKKEKLDKSSCNCLYIDLRFHQKTHETFFSKDGTIFGITGTLIKMVRYGIIKPLK